VCLAGSRRRAWPDPRKRAAPSHRTHALRRLTSRRDNPSSYRALTSLPAPLRGGPRCPDLDPRRRAGQCGAVSRVSCSASIRRSLERGVRGPIHRLRRVAAASWLVRLVVLVALVPVGLSFAMPALARAVAGPPPHVCHCDVRHGHASCACPKCFPDLEEPGFGEDVLRGQCGDVEAAVRDTMALDAGVPSPAFVLAPAFVGPALRCRAVVLPEGPPSAPPRRPPRSARSSSHQA
jgi:hypothetical protein